MYPRIIVRSGYGGFGSSSAGGGGSGMDVDQAPIVGVLLE